MRLRKTMLKSKNPARNLHLRYLKKVLFLNRIPRHYYSIGTYSEEAVCMEYEGGNWIVYSGERGQKYDLKKHSDIENACIDMLKRLSEHEYTENRMVKQFHYLLLTGNHRSGGGPAFKRKKTAPMRIEKAKA